MNDLFLFSILFVILSFAIVIGFTYFKVKINDLYDQIEFQQKKIFKLLDELEKKPHVPPKENVQIPKKEENKENGTKEKSKSSKSSKHKHKPKPINTSHMVAPVKLLNTRTRRRSQFSL